MAISSGLEDAEHLVLEGIDVRDVLKHIRAIDDVKLTVGKRNLAAVIDGNGEDRFCQIMAVRHIDRSNIVAGLGRTLGLPTAAAADFQ